MMTSLTAALTRARFTSISASLLMFALVLLTACESKPVVEEAMDEDGDPAIVDPVETTNVEAEAEKLPGMPQGDMNNVLPGAR